MIQNDGSNSPLSPVAAQDFTNRLRRQGGTASMAGPNNMARFAPQREPWRPPQNRPMPIPGGGPNWRQQPTNEFQGMPRPAGGPNWRFQGQEGSPYPDNPMPPPPPGKGWTPGGAPKDYSGMGFPVDTGFGPGEFQGMPRPMPVAPVKDWTPGGSPKDYSGMGLGDGVPVPEAKRWVRPIDRYDANPFADEPIYPDTGFGAGERQGMPIGPVDWRRQVPQRDPFRF